MDHREWLQGYGKDEKLVISNEMAQRLKREYKKLTSTPFKRELVEDRSQLAKSDVKLVGSREQWEFVKRERLEHSHKLKPRSSSALLRDLRDSLPPTIPILSPQPLVVMTSPPGTHTLEHWDLDHDYSDYERTNIDKTTSTAKQCQKDKSIQGNVIKMHVVPSVKQHRNSSNSKLSGDNLQAPTSLANDETSTLDSSHPMAEEGGRQSARPSPTTPLSSNKVAAENDSASNFPSFDGARLTTPLCIEWSPNIRPPSPASQIPFLSAPGRLQRTTDASELTTSPYRLLLSNIVAQDDEKVPMFILPSSLTSQSDMDLDNYRSPGLKSSIQESGSSKRDNDELAPGSGTRVRVARQLPRRDSARETTEAKTDAKALGVLSPARKASTGSPQAAASLGTSTSDRTTSSLAENIAHDRKRDLEAFIGSRGKGNAPNKVARKRPLPHPNVPDASSWSPANLPVTSSPCHRDLPSLYFDTPTFVKTSIVHQLGSRRMIALEPMLTKPAHYQALIKAGMTLVDRTTTSHASVPDLIVSPGKCVWFLPLTYLPGRAFRRDELERGTTSQGVKEAIFTTLKGLTRHFQSTLLVLEQNSSSTLFGSRSSMVYSRDVQHSAELAAQFALFGKHNVDLGNDCEWLTDDPTLVLVKQYGLNAFAACFVLGRTDLQDFLHMTTEQRIDTFAPIVEERVLRNIPPLSQGQNSNPTSDATFEDDVIDWHRYEHE
ncbi:hypothetical protein OIO90_000568 [Microbotryomycetes sp. JL221]|nr:hypothetical protein OIO90_000568 [Microbotryomycetes sp. JL221]